MPKWVATHSPSSSRIWPTPRVAQRLVGDRDVRREGGHAARDRPRVQVVHVGHALGADEVLADHLHVDPGRRGLEQHVQAVAQQRPGARQDQHRDQQRGDRVGAVEPGGQHHQAGDDRGGRPEGVTEHLEEGARACSATPRAGRRAADRDQVGDQADGREDQHLAGIDADGVEQSSYAGDGEVATDAQQDDRVDQGGEDLGAVVAEGPPRGRRAAWRRTTRRGPARSRRCR